MIKSEDSESSIKYLGIEAVNAMPCYKLIKTNKYGDNITLYIDTTTYYLTEIETILTTDEQEKEYFIRYGDYHKQDDIVLPMSFATNSNSETIFKYGETKFKKIEINVPLDDTLFTTQIKR